MKTKTLALLMTITQGGGALAARSALGQSTAPLELNDPVTLTFYSEAGFWGTRLTVQVFPNAPEETTRRITATAIENANLFNRISAVRLDCGSRGAMVRLFRGQNTSQSVFSWAENSADRFLACDPGMTATLNLHDGGAGLADHLGSAFLLVHARAAEVGFFSTYLLDGWNDQLDDLPDGASADGGPELWLTSMTSFRIRQDVTLDSFWCDERAAQFELQAQLYGDGHFNVLVASTYVDPGWTDFLGCRTEMENALDAAVSDAANDLEEGLQDIEDIFVPGDHPRHYFVPNNSLHDDFWLAGGGDAVLVPDGVILK